jgi:hypothetical protein
MKIFGSSARVVIDPENEVRPGYSAQIFTGRLAVCGDCNGTGMGTDTDGSVTGRVGTPITCSCAGGGR